MPAFAPVDRPPSSPVGPVAVGSVGVVVGAAELGVTLGAGVVEGVVTGSFAAVEDIAMIDALWVGSEVTPIVAPATLPIPLAKIASWQPTGLLQSSNSCESWIGPQRSVPFSLIFLLKSLNLVSRAQSPTKACSLTHYSPFLPRHPQSN
jgi:hypothetical protein